MKFEVIVANNPLELQRETNKFLKKYDIISVNGSVDKGIFYSFITYQENTDKY